MFCLILVFKVMTECAFGSQLRKHLACSDEVIVCTCRDCEDGVAETGGGGALSEDVFFADVGFGHYVEWEKYSALRGAGLACHGVAGTQRLLWRECDERDTT